MISIQCQCGSALSASENERGVDCSECGRRVRLVCAESLPDGAGSGDFDAMLVQRKGPAIRQANGGMALGGCADIVIGRLAGSTIELPGQKVSRRHAKLVRIDFGPSRWTLADAGSSGGVFVNGQRIAEHELEPGDSIVIGEYQFEYSSASVSVPQADVGTAIATASTPPPIFAARGASGRGSSGGGFWTAPRLIGGALATVVVVTALAFIIRAMSALPAVDDRRAAAKSQPRPVPPPDVTSSGLSGKELTPVVDPPRQPEIPLEKPPETPPDAPLRAARPELSAFPTITLPPRTPVSLGEARKGFKTKLSTQVSSADPVATPPAKVFRTVRYDAPPGQFAAYLSPDPGGGAKHPAIIWIVGGDCNTIGDVWTPDAPSNDQTAAAYRNAGIVMMFPSLRGANGNPGRKEGFYGEVDDVLAAATYLAAQPYVDPARIYLGGHSTGGTLALLAAECSDRFRAVISFGPVEEVTRYGEGTVALPFDKEDVREVNLRSPIAWLHGLRTPTFVFEGDGDPSNDLSLIEMARSATTPNLKCFTVKGMTHFSILAPMNKIIAAKITGDTGPATNLSFAQAELPGLTPVQPRMTPPPPGPITMAVTAKPAKEPDLRVSIDRMAWEVGAVNAPSPDTARYAGKYVEMRGAVDRAGFSTVHLGTGASAPASFELTCHLVKDPLQDDLVEDLAPAQEVVICGTLGLKSRRWEMTDCVLVAVGPDPSMKVTVDQIRKEFAADPQGSGARYKDKIVILDGTVRELDEAKYQVMLDGASPDPSAPPVRVVVGSIEFSSVKRYAAGGKLRMKGRFSEFRDNQVVLGVGSVLADRSAARATGPAPATPPTARSVGATRNADPTPPRAAGAADVPSVAEPEIVGTEEGRPGSYSFPTNKQMVGIRYNLTKGAGPAVLRSVSAFTSKSVPPLRGTEKSVQARDGYMVYGLTVDGDKYVNAIRIVFVRVDGDRLVPADTYTSDWLGTPLTDKPTTLGANGRRVTGIRFFAESRLNAIGLNFGSEK